MVGSDSRVEDIKRFPPFVGLHKPQTGIRFSYCLGRENKSRSAGWVDLQPVNGVVGPELSFAREVGRHVDAPIAIIKCAAGGTHLGGDWNPEKPSGFEMYPLALELIQDSLDALKRQGIAYRLEGFMWHQGENDMFEEAYMENYGKNLRNFLARWRRDLKAPNLKFYIGELCTKTVWGMDLRPRMYAISQGQRAVTSVDPQAEYIPTSHVGVEIGHPVGLHYHYGTLGQLEHGVNYATAYLKTIGKYRPASRKLSEWPYAPASKVRLFVLAGHRNMEGERAFVQEVAREHQDLLLDQPRIAYRYSLGGGYKVSEDWEPLGPVGYYDTFGPELSFANVLRERLGENVAIAKFTHSGSQLNDWTPTGSLAKSRHLFPRFVQFIRASVQALEKKGHEVELAGIFYHLGENEMAMPPYRKKAVSWLQEVVTGVREELSRPTLPWYVSQQKPLHHESVNAIDVTTELQRMAKGDPDLVHIQAFGLPPQQKELVIDTAGIIALGRVLANRYIDLQ